MKDKELLILDKNTAEISVSNKSLAQTLDKIKTKIHNLLREELNNKNFELKVKIEDVQKKKSEHLYTDRDRYQYLVEKNPNIEILKNKLDLEF